MGGIAPDPATGNMGGQVLQFTRPYVPLWVGLLRLCVGVVEDLLDAGGEY
jgi:hypothetical protein